MPIYIRWQQTYFEFTYTWSDQFLDVTPWVYRIICKWAWSNTSAWWLWQWEVTISSLTTLAIMVWQKWNATSGWTYWFGGTSNLGSDRSWWWLSWVFTWGWAITSNDSARALVIWWWAWAWWRWAGWAWGWETGADWVNSWYWTLWWWWTQTWHWSSWNAWNAQFQWWWWGWTYWYWWGGWWRWGNASVWDSSADDDKWWGWWSWYVISTASNRVLTQWWGSAAWQDWFVTIEFIWGI